MKTKLALVLVLMLSFAQLQAGEKCDQEAYRQFSFWLGTWQVFTPDGNLAGVNTISVEEGGCVLHERYSTGRGYSGQSFSLYLAAQQRWHQTWVDNQGSLLLLQGGLQGPSMVLEGEAAIDASTRAWSRITWTPNADASVRQHWQYQASDGQWRTLFDGLYRPLVKVEP